MTWILVAAAVIAVGVLVRRLRPTSPTPDLVAPITPSDWSRDDP